jgi:YesN/AraC family two-component response regulator
MCSASARPESRKLVLAGARADPGQFDLAVTDYNMPGMSGLDMAQALKEIRADLSVVLESGYITEELRQKAPAVR